MGVFLILQNVALVDFKSFGLAIHFEHNTPSSVHAEVNMFSRKCFGFYLLVKKDFFFAFS